VSQLITSCNREPIKRTAQRIGVSARTAIELAKRGQLAAEKIVYPSGRTRWFSSSSAAEALFVPATEIDWVERMRSVVKSPRYGTKNGARSVARRKAL